MSANPDLPELWERQKKESEQAYYAFCVFRDQDAPRALPKVVSQMLDAGTPKALPTLKRWSATWAWRERARAWDMHLEEQVRRDQIRDTKAMARRQARDAHAIQLALISPVEVLLKRLNDPLRIGELEAMTTGDLLALSVLAARAFPRIARSERDARGAPIQDLSQFLDQDTGLVEEERTSPREAYEWMRDALSALEEATGGRLGLPAAGETT